MINIIIEVIVSQKNKMPLKEKIVFTILVIVIFAPLAFLYLFLLDTSKISWVIAASITALAVPIVIFVFENKRIDDAMNNYINYNKKLDKLRNILMDLTYYDNEIQYNWYSKSKICYLIEESNKLIDESSSPKKKAMEFLKFMILPIISFVAGVIANKASLEISLSLSVIAFTFALSLWGISQIIEFIGDIVLKSSSLRTIKSVNHQLNDLLERDFGIRGNSEE